jgi:hypothetical protein
LTDRDVDRRADEPGEVGGGFALGLGKASARALGGLFVKGAEMNATTSHARRFGLLADLLADKAARSVRLG